MTIKVHYSSIDGFRQTRTFKTLEGARKYAAKWVGDSPDMGGWYAVSFDGIGKVTVSGDATLREVFGVQPEREYADQRAHNTFWQTAAERNEDSDWEGPSRYT